VPRLSVLSTICLVVEAAEGSLTSGSCQNFSGGGCQDGADGSDQQAKVPSGIANHEECDMQFLISMLINPAVLDALTDEEKAAIGDGHGRFIAALRQSGELITTQALADPSQAAVVTVRNGQPVVTDGPFLEAKEHLGGFYLIDCEDKDRAIELAAQIPDAAIEGLGIEVRQVMFAAGQLET
jgi:hypothetical protein